MIKPILFFFITCILILSGNNVFSQTAEDIRQQLIENQRNIAQLRSEKQDYEEKLYQLELILDDSESYKAKLEELKTNIELTETMIDNISAVVSGQRLLLATLESGENPSSLDIALNKALSTNLTELAEDFSHDEQAQKEIARLKKLLREESRIGSRAAGNDTLVVATDQQTAEKEFLHLLSLFSSVDLDEAEAIPDKSVMIRGSRSGELFRLQDTINYLGQSQYHMEFTAYEGDMSISIDQGKPWRFHIPEKDNGATYILIYDLTNQLRPRVVMFNKSKVVVE